MILSVSNISKSFGTDTVLKNVSFHVNEHEKAAIVGINGAGKSTLLKIIMGEMLPDTGTVTFAKGITVGYLAQHQDMSAHRTIYEEVSEGRKDLLDMEERLHSMEDQMKDLKPSQVESFMEKYHELLAEFEARNGFALRSEISGILKGLGFADADFGKYCDELSGGQKTRVSLARILVTRPDLILLDEPTNHLDITSIQWLENFLLNYDGAVVIVAHDRYFLDKVVSKVIAISLHEAVVYSGNYTEYAQKAAQRREAQLRAYMNQQREIAHEKQVIEKLKSFNREKSVKRAESREKKLEKMDVLEKPQEENGSMKITLEPDIVSGNDVLTVEGLAKSYGEKKLFEDISFEIKRGERVALIGQNGTGKTTILKILNKRMQPDAGSFRLGTNVKIGYYDQEQQNLHMEKTLFEEISDAYPSLNQTRIRTVLAAFLFTDEDVFKHVSDLSGGERGRLSLAKLMLSDANFLILDEPTNHLDIESKEILESALNSYTGTVLFVSHDRYFINQTATRILNLTHRKIVNYIGNYDYYLEKRETNEKAAFQNQVSEHSAMSAAGTLLSGEKETSASAGDGKADWAKQKARQAEKRKKENRIAGIENRISSLEQELDEIMQAFSDTAVATNSAKLNELHGRQVKIQEELDALYEEWETLEE